MDVPGALVQIIEETFVIQPFGSPADSAQPAAPERFSMSACLWWMRILLPLLPATATDAQEPQNLILTAADEWPIHISYYNAKPGRGDRERPVVVLLTAANGEKGGVTRRIWKETAEHLFKNKFAVVTVDLRKHGDSLLEDGGRRNRFRTSDYRSMVLGDMEAVKAFLVERHQDEQLNIRKLGIVASGASCLVASAFALNDWNKLPHPDAPRMEERTPRGQDVRALVMISPRKTPGFSTSRILKPLSNPEWGIAFRIYHSSTNKDEETFARRLYRYVELNSAEYGDLRSIDSRPGSAEKFLVGRLGDYFRKDVTKYLQTHLTELESPWRTRQSPLNE